MKKEFGCVDCLWQLFRIAVLGSIIYGVYYGLEIHSKEQQWLADWDGWFYVFSAVGGWLLYSLLMSAFSQYMKVVHNCDAPYEFDAVFLFDDEKNISNILGCVIVEEFAFEGMKQSLIERTARMEKCRSKLCKQYGLWWYKKMTDEEWK